MSFLIGVIDCVDDVRENHVVISVDYVNEIILVSVLKRNEVSSHEATDKILVLFIGVATLVVRFLFKSSVRINPKVGESLSEF